MQECTGEGRAQERGVQADRYKEKGRDSCRRGWVQKRALYRRGVSRRGIVPKRGHRRGMCIVYRRGEVQEKGLYTKRPVKLYGL